MNLTNLTNYVQQKIDALLLNVIYFGVVGPTAILAKLVGKSFLKINPKKSAWKKTKYEDLDKMY